MNNNSQSKIILTLSIPMTVLVIVTTCVGLFVPNFYSRETHNWMVQSVGQDMVDLFLAVPFLIVTTILAYRKSRAGLMIWSGTVLYIIYTFLIFCFAVHFNSLFIVYCFVLGLSSYSFLYYLFSNIVQPIENWFNDKLPRKTISITRKLA